MMWIAFKLQFVRIKFVLCQLAAIHFLIIDVQIDYSKADEPYW